MSGYDVSCRCGHRFTGTRLPTPQTFSCPQCGQHAFVFPESPWGGKHSAVPAPAAPPSPDAPATPPPPRAFADWLRTYRVAWVSGLVTLVLVGVVVAVLVPVLLQRPPATSVAGDHERVQARRAAGRAALAEGHFQVARNEYTAACDLWVRHPNALSPREGRDLVQSQRQADLLSRLLTLSLQDVVREAAAAGREDDWDARFRREHEGKTVVFDDVVRIDPAGKPYLWNTALDGGVKARVSLADLALLRDLTLDPPQRLLFGARLAKVRKEGEVWVVRFQPDSGVLLTEADAVLAAGLPLDEGMTEVLQNQAKWLDALPAQEPAKP